MKKNTIIICLLLLVCFLPINTFGECIKGDCVNGKGTFAFSDGSKYVGQFKDGFPNGQGTHTLPNGDNYVGEWKNGKKHGKGVYTYPVGIRLICEWKDGKFLY